MRNRTPEEEERERAIAARVAEFLDQKKTEYFAKQQASKDLHR